MVRAALWLFLAFGAAVGLVMVHITCEPDPLFFPLFFY